MHALPYTFFKKEMRPKHFCASETKAGDTNYKHGVVIAVRVAIWFSAYPRVNLTESVSWALTTLNHIEQGSDLHAEEFMVV